MAQRPDPNQVENPGGPGIPPTAVIRDKQNPARMTADPKAPPFIDPRIADPMALRYAQQAETRRRNAVPKTNALVAGGPDILIPHLGGEVVPGLTMAEHARLQRGMPQHGEAPPPAPDLSKIIGDAGLQPALGGRGIIEGDAHYAPPAAPAKNSANDVLTGLLNTDTLPPAAQQDPMFQTGGGAMFAVNQPHLARKYGVMRSGQHVPAQALIEQQRRVSQVRSGAPATASPMKQETIEGLQALEAFNKQRNKSEIDDSDDKVDAAALRGPAGGAGSTERKLSDEERQKQLDEMDQFDVNRVRNAMFKDLLNNDEQRKLIESRLEPLDLGRLIVEGVVTQRVIISKGVFEPVFQTYGADEDLKVKLLIGEETRANQVTDQYALDKYSIMGLTIALYAINKTVLPGYRDAAGDFSEELFWAKYKIVSRLNFHMLGSLLANWFWFDVRVRKLYRAEDLGNG